MLSLPLLIYPTDFGRGEIERHWLMKVQSTDFLQPLGAFLLFTLLIAAIHGPSRLGAGFILEDGAHLSFATRHLFLDMFTDREVMLEQSYAHITPVLGGAIRAGILLIGLNPHGHYVLALVPITLTCLFTWFLLRHRVSTVSVVASLALWISLPSVTSVSSMLSTVHYAWGLAFFTAALYCFSRAQKDSVSWLVPSALLYALSCLSKEIYVPALVVFVLWPGLTWGKRLRSGAPFIIVAILYAALRAWLFSGVGGYASIQLSSASIDPARVLIQILQALFGTGFFAHVGGVLIVCSIVHAGLFRGSAPFIYIVLFSLAALAPIVPVLIFEPDIPYGAARLTYLCAWGLVFLLALMINGSRFRVALVFGASALYFISSNLVSAEFGDNHRQAKLGNGYLLVEPSSSPPLVTLHSYEVGYMSALREARRNYSGEDSPGLITRVEELESLGNSAKVAKIWSNSCKCLEQLGDQAQQILTREREAVTAGMDSQMATEMFIWPTGDRRFKVEWKFESSDAHRYSVEVQGIGELPMPASGQKAAGLDTTFRPSDPMRVRVRMVTRDEALVYSEWMDLPLRQPGHVTWTNANDRR